MVYSLPVKLVLERAELADTGSATSRGRRGSNARNGYSREAWTLRQAMLRCAVLDGAGAERREVTSRRSLME